jgi:hypothetical protein
MSETASNLLEEHTQVHTHTLSLSLSLSLTTHTHTYTQTKIYPHTFTSPIRRCIEERKYRLQ